MMYLYITRLVRSGLSVGKVGARGNKDVGVGGLKAACSDVPQGVVAIGARYARD